jgi:hypothetical protein
MLWKALRFVSTSFIFPCTVISSPSSTCKHFNAQERTSEESQTGSRASKRFSLSKVEKQELKHTPIWKASGGIVKKDFQHDLTCCHQSQKSFSSTYQPDVWPFLAHVHASSLVEQDTPAIVQQPQGVPGVEIALAPP